MNHRLSQQFLEFAKSECLGSSELYYHLSLAIAKDQELLKLAESGRKGQPTPNLFFGVAHYLLNSNLDAPLAKFFPTCSESCDRSPEEAFPDFKHFILSHRDNVTQLLATRLVQTNEVRRCAYLFPAMMYAGTWFDKRPLALIEIGTSAGLNLLWDKYSYQYGDWDVLGDRESPVVIRSECRGVIPDGLFHAMPRITQRIGLDLNIVDVTQFEEAAWLRALIWPEHKERREILDAALKHRASFDLDLRQGNGFAMLAGIIETIPKDSVACVYHTHVANQITREAKESLLVELAELGTSRDIIHIFNNIKPSLHLTLYKDGRAEDIPLANTDGHARWFEWLPSDRQDGESRL
ncbi:MAG: DUF2332 domain-containing protein [Verrucomicrobiota bacterium]